MISKVHSQESSLSRSPGQGPELNHCCWVKKVGRGLDEVSHYSSSQLFSRDASGTSICTILEMTLNTWSQIQGWEREGIAECIRGLGSFLAFHMAVSVNIGQTGTVQSLSFLLVHQELLFPLGNRRWLGDFFFLFFLFSFFQSGNHAVRLASVWLVGSIERLAVPTGQLSRAQTQLFYWVHHAKSFSYLLPWLLSLKFWLPVGCSGMAR